MKLFTEEGEQVTTSQQPFSSGGEGGVYHVHTSPFGRGYCAKIYHNSNQKQQAKLKGIEAKLRYMLEHQPSELMGNMWALSWPVSLLYTAKQEFRGFVMPLAFDGSVKLTELISSIDTPSPLKKSFWDHWSQDDWDRFSLRSKEGLLNRLKLIVNICMPINKVHQVGSYVFVDMKPSNILVNGKGQITLCDMDSLQISDKGKLIFPSPVNTPDYTPPDTIRKIKIQMYDGQQQDVPVFDESWDRYSLGVIIYQMLFMMHPFACTAMDDSLTTTTEKVAKGLYVHGTLKGQIKKAHPYHDNLKRCPKIVQDLFFKTFDPSKGLKHPIQRTSANDWGLNLYAEIQKLSLNSQPIDGGSKPIPPKPNPKPKPNPRPNPRPNPNPTPISQPLSLWGYFWRCVTNKFADFKGRARRKEYWGFVLYNNLFSGLALWLAYNGIVPNVAIFILPILFFLPRLSVTARRLHDIGIPAWGLLVLLVPILNLYYVYMLMFAESAGDNKYGPSPK
ncbi:hypothetical protein T231_01745 [Tannerella sp. oral taxon BU063 isolate Cell 6/7/9]|uniref:Protein kinase domain-containing protein n=1 Tax=Tannerella sp. oral taxon BU063 isolate Cell 6/7/9 TaxID=1411021 RepID=W2CWR7_9BACT|nr:hypothetical protein T231_01745 [Tannerella sp. oral taxon BU063 isolate Cell 6/7/9]